MRTNLPDKSLFLNKDIPSLGYRIEEYIDSGGNGHMFRAYSEVIATNMACKIIPKKNLEKSMHKSGKRTLTKLRSLLPPKIVILF